MKYILPLLLLFSTQLVAQLERDSVQVIYDQSRHIRFELVDVDGDQDLDIIANQKGYNGNFVLYKNIDGLGNYAPRIAFGEQTWEDLPDVTTNFSLGDIDQDGDIDLIPGNIVKASKPFWENDGLGVFNYIPEMYSANDAQQDYHRQAIDDINGDGLLDIIMFKTGAIALQLNINNGVGNDFEYIPTIDIEGNLSNNFHTWTLFDFDQDGDNDIAYVVERYLSDTEKEIELVVLDHQCDFCYEEYSRTPIDTVSGFFSNIQLEAAPFDDNIFPDLVINYRSYEISIDGESVEERTKLSILQNDITNNQFTPVFDAIDFFDFSIADIDNDGRLDMALVFDTDMDASSMAEKHYYTFRNLGDFQFDINLIDELEAGRHLQLADINSDGLVDLVSFDQRGFLFVRTATGDFNFSPVRSLNQPISLIQDTSPSDWDEDGDIDIVSFGTTDIDGNSLSGVFVHENLGEGIFAPTQQLMSIDAAYSYETKQFVHLNNDDLIDVISIETNHVDNQNQSLLIAYIAIAEQGFQEIVINDGFLEGVNYFNTGDFDQDGDEDLIWYDYDADQLKISWNNLADGGGFTSEATNLAYNYTYDHTFEVADINGDGYPDIFLDIDDEYQWATKLEEGSQFTDLRPINFSDNIALWPPVVRTNFDDDPQAELLFRGRVGGSFIHLMSSNYLIDADSFSTPKILNSGENNLTYRIVPLDINEDGLLDIINEKGFSLNIPGSDYFTESYQATPFDESIFFPFFNDPFLSDIDNDGEKEIISHNNYGIIHFDKSFMDNKMLQGHVRLDEQSDCVYNDTLMAMNNWRISVNHELRDQLTNTNTDGHYAAYLPHDGEYTVRPIPPSNYWQSCPEDSVFTISTNSENVDSVQFLAQALVDCPLVVIDLTSTSVSQCFGSSISVNYNNVGTAIAYDANIEVHFDERLSVVFSSIPWLAQTDTSLLFSFDEIGVGEQGFITINFEPDCSSLELGEDICFDAFITPAELCDDMILNWNGANLEATSFCENNETAFRIVNTGNNAMDMAEQYRVNIVNDDIILYLNDNVILEPGEADTIWLPVLDNGLWHLSLNQPQGHPYPEPISLLTSSCNAMTNTPNLLPSGDGDPFHESLCRTVLGPYDPNDKSATPIGIGVLNEIEKDWELTYTIQFQNTGNDRARTVVLRDQLSEWLDLTSFRPIGASHDYEWNILTGRELTITFPEINLIDSTANEVESHGFFSFAIRPKADIPVETVINNTAYIYFDLNPPIQTGTVVHQIKKPVHSAAVHHEFCAGSVYQDIAIWQDTILQEIQDYVEYDSITFHHLNVLEIASTIEEITFLESLTWEGLIIETDTLIERTYIATNGCDSLVTYQFSLITSTQNINKENNYSLSPNPAKDFTILTIDQNIGTPDVLELFDNKGVLIKKWSPTLVHDHELNIDTSILPKGYYILNIIKNDSVHFLELVVQ